MHLGNCIDVLSTLDRVDHVITDPPYCLDFGKCVTRGRRDATTRKRPMGYAAFAPDDVRAVGPILAGLASRWCLVWSDVESTALWREALAELRYVRTGAWFRTNPCPQFTGDRPGIAFEAVTICHAQGRMRWNGGGCCAAWSHHQPHGTTGGPENDHPTPKPLALMLDLVADFTDPGETILDPFAGSGTTGVAALRLGRKFIGVEKDPKYFALAVERLRAEENGSTLSAARAGQLPLLGGSQ